MSPVGTTTTDPDARQFAAAAVSVVEVDRPNRQKRRQPRGPMHGAFGALVGDGSLVGLTAKDPMVLEHRKISQERRTGPGGEIDGEAWMETGRNYDLRRVEFLATS